MARIRLPGLLRQYAEGRNVLETSGATVGEALDNAIALYPRLGQHLLDENGALLTSIHYFIHEHDVRDLQGKSTSLHPEDTLIVVLPISGGG
jgi:molybdopterin converting factor small subunit